MVVSDTKNSVVTSSRNMSTRRGSSKQENVNLNCQSNGKDKHHCSEIVSWTSLPANLLKNGKVYTLCSIC